MSQGFDFFVQNLITYPVDSNIDPSLSQPLPLNSELLYQKWQQAASFNPNLDLPTALQSARISNTTYYEPDDVGGAPCKSPQLSILETWLYTAFLNTD